MTTHTGSTFMFSKNQTLGVTNSPALAAKSSAPHQSKLHNQSNYKIGTGPNVLLTVIWHNRRETKSQSDVLKSPAEK